MKVLHTADVHYSLKNLEEIDKCFGFVVERSIQEKVDLAIIAGDFIDEYWSSIKLEDVVLERASERLKELADHCPVFLLQGTYSHEHPGSLSIFSKLRAKNRIYVSEKIEQVFLERNGWFLENESFHSESVVVFSALPPVNKAYLMAYGDKKSKEVNHEIKDLLLDVFRGFGIVNDRCLCPTIFVGHGSITGAEISEGQAMVGKDIEFPIQDLRQAKCSACCLGHIHKTQAWGEVMYSGSICPLDFGEDDVKGFNILTFEGKELTNVDFIKTPYRKRVTVDLGANPDLDAISKLQDGTDAFVRVRYNVDEENRNGIRAEDIRTVFSSAHDVKIEKTIIPKERVRSAGISQVKSLDEKIRRWGQTVNIEIPPGVLEKAKILQESGV